MIDNTIFCPSLSEAFAQVGLPYPDAGLTPGKITRFPTNVHPGDTSGWCRLYEDGVGAVFGCWREGSSYVWQMRDANAPRPTKEEMAATRAAHAQAKQKVEEELAIAHVAAAAEAARLIAESMEIDSSHPYVKKKGIVPYLARQDCDGNLVLPILDGDGQIQTLQYIYLDKKRFLSGGKLAGGFLLIGTPSSGLPIIVVEGWATGCSVHEATGYPVAVAFSGSNLKAVTLALGRRYPEARLIVAGDRDSHGKGLQYAQAAAAVVRAQVVMPAFVDGRDKGDCNDLHQAEGLGAVRKLFDQLGTTAVTLVPLVAPVNSAADVRDGTSTTFPLTQLGNAARLYNAHGRHIRYVPDTEAWLVWKDGAWACDQSGADVRFLAAQLHAAIYAEGLQHLAQADKFSSWARTSQQLNTITATVSLLSDYPPIRLSLDRIDADPYLIGFDGGRHVIDLRSGASRLASIDDYVTKSLGPEELGRPEAATRWHSFLAQVFNGDSELIDWLHRFCGYMLTGSTEEQFFVFAFGLGANGKSIFAETLKHVMGDYAKAVAPETLSEMRRQAGGATPDLAALIGTRLALSTETEEGSALAETLIKSLVAGDTMSVRQLYAAPVQFKPCFKLLMMGNHKPTIRGTDHGIWRRVRLIPFTRTFSPEERDPQLLTKLKAETPHILAWMIQGCMEWNQRGLRDIPSAIHDATEQYRREQDVIAEWIAECCIAVQTAETRSIELYGSYREWCDRNGQRPSNSKTLGRRLGEKGFTMRRSNGKTLWRGIELGPGQRYINYSSAKWEGDM